MSATVYYNIYIYYNNKSFVIIMSISALTVCASGNEHHFEEDFVQTFFAKADTYVLPLKNITSIVTSIVTS